MVLKQERRGLEKKFYELCLPIITESGYNLYDLDYLAGSHTLRVFIEDNASGSAQLEDCVKVDKALTPSLDEADWAPESLVLEVSSPGVYRQLNAVEHFERALGKKIQLELNKKFVEFLGPDGGQETSRRLKNEKKIIGNLKEMDSTGLKMNIKEFGEIYFPFKSIKKANLETDLDL